MALTQEQKDFDISLDKEVEAKMEKWLEGSKEMLDVSWVKTCENDEEIRFFVKNRIRRAFEAGVANGIND